MATPPPFAALLLEQHRFLPVAGELIDYAHTKQIKVVLGFTPFAYDGANQYPLEHPQLKATQKNGEPAKLWGLHAWGIYAVQGKRLSTSVPGIVSTAVV